MMMATEDRIFLTHLYMQEDQDKLHIAVIGLKQKLEDHPVIQCLALFVCYNITLVVT